MPIYIKESKGDPAKPGSPASSDSKLKQLATLLHGQVKQLTASIRKLKSEKRALEHQLTQKDHDLKQLKQELLQIKQRDGKRNVGHREFGD